MPSPSVSILTSWRPACSPALRAGVWGLYIGGAACFGDSIAPCVSVCVCMGVSGCVSVDMCMCRMKCRLPPMRHTRRHTCTHKRGWLLCKNWRRRGSHEWIRSGHFFLLLFAEWVLWHSGVLLQCVSIYCICVCVCVCVSVRGQNRTEYNIVMGHAQTLFTPWES